MKQKRRSSGKHAFANRNARRKLKPQGRKDLTRSQSLAEERQKLVRLGLAEGQNTDKGLEVRDASPAAAPTPNSAAQSPTPVRNPDGSANLPSLMSGQTTDADQQRLQEEYMRILLGGAQQNQSGQGQQPGMPDENDPMIKMMQTMLGGMSGDPNAPGTGDMPFSADDISKMTGMPSFLTNMFMGGNKQTPPTPEQINKERRWKVVRIVVSILMGIYTVVTLDNSIDTFGTNPPAPATVQNPFVVFLMGELLLQGGKSALFGRPTNQGTIKSWIASVREVAADGAILLFMLGVYSWWVGST